MKTIILAMCLALTACAHKEEPQVHHEVQHSSPHPEPVPVATNPFEKPPSKAPLPFHEAVQASHWEQVGGGFKMNESWSLWTWRDSANHTTCYFYNVMADKRLIGHGMSCVKE
jgi:hypothetical protein